MPAPMSARVRHFSQRRDSFALAAAGVLLERARELEALDAGASSHSDPPTDNLPLPAAQR